MRRFLELRKLSDDHHQGLVLARRARQTAAGTGGYTVEGVWEEIARRFSEDLRGVPSVGDSLRDLQASVAVGAQPILVRTGKGEKTLETGNLPENTWVCADLAEAAQRIIYERTPWGIS